MVKFPREHFRIESVEDAKFFLSEYIPAGKTVSCRDVINAGLCYEFVRDSNGQVTTTSVHYGDDSIDHNAAGDAAITEAYQARQSINAKWFPGL